MGDAIRRGCGRRAHGSRGRRELSARACGYQCRLGNVSASERRQRLLHRALVDWVGSECLLKLLRHRTHVDQADSERRLRLCRHHIHVDRVGIERLLRLRRHHTHQALTDHDDGDFKHSFENGQRKHKSWRGKSETTVLMNRAGTGKKPIASIVIQPRWNKGCVTQLINRIRRRTNLKFHVIKNDWNVTVVYFTATPENNLAALFAERGEDVGDLKHRPEVKGRTLEYDVKRGFDMSSVQSPVSASLWR